MPATGPGSRGGRGSRGRRGTRGQRDTLFTEIEPEEGDGGDGDKEEGAEGAPAGSATPAEWPTASAGPSSSAQQERAPQNAEQAKEGCNVDDEGDVAMAEGGESEEDELREINDDDMQAMRKD